MIKELRKLRNKPETRPLANYIAIIQKRGKLKIYYRVYENGKFAYVSTEPSDKSYIAYDTLEFKQMKKDTKRGRPLKILKDK